MPRFLSTISLGLALAAALVAGESGVTIPRGLARHAVTSWMTGNGLPDDRVTSVLQGSDGYLWVGTESGLARFDGLRFTNFRSANTPALISQSIRALWEDRAGNLWIGTDSGLLRRRGDQWEATDLVGHTVHALVEDAAGVLWAATTDGIFRREGAHFRRIPLGLPGPAGRAQAIYADATGRVWLAFAGRPGAVVLKDGVAEAFDASGELRQEVLSVAQTPDGAMWFGTVDGLVRWHRGQARRVENGDGSGSRRIAALHVDGAGALWVAGAGLQRISGGEITSIVAAAPNGATTVNSLSHDRDGNIWMGTADAGLLRVRQPAWQLIGLGARGTETGFRTVMQANDGTVWLAQGSRGFAKVGVDGQVVRLPTPDTEAYGEAIAAFALPTGELFFAHRRALVIERAGRREALPELPEARAFFAARDGSLWIGVRDRGIHVWRNGRLARVALPGDADRCTVSSFTETPDGRILAGTWRHGLVTIAGSEATVWDRSGGAPADDLRVVFADRQGAVWVAAPGLGLCLLEGGRLRVAEWTSEVFDEQIDSISQDASDNLWLASATGVNFVAREDLLATIREQADPKRLQVTRVTEGYRNPIDDLACFPNVCHTRAGLYWFATRDGILLGDASKAIVSPQPPPVHIERVVAGGRVLPPGGPVVLPAGTSGLLIEYSGVNLTAPRRVRFQYRLKGIDPEWVDAGERRVASYASLPPGRHEFQVIASSADGVWNEQGAVLPFVQEAHLHQRAWFYPVLALGGIGAAFLVGRWRVASLRREKARLERAIAERTGELRAAKDLAEASTRAKSEFLQGISHEIRNPLNGIIGLAGMLREGGAAARQDELLVALRACSKSLARVFDEVLSFTRLEHGQVTLRESPFSVGSLAEELAAMFRAAAPGPAPMISVEIEPGVPDRLRGDEEKLRTIVGNFLGNALRHAPGAPVTLTISADSVNEYAAGLTFVVSDRGPGIPEAEQELIFGKYIRGSGARAQRTPGTGLGLATCRALAELLGGHVGVDSIPGQGASFFLILRLQRDQAAAPEPRGLPIGRTAPRRRALVVEDQTYNQIVVRRIAEELGFEADVASDAGSALRQVQARDYDLVLLDWELPDMEGERVARAIRARPGGESAVILATTAHDGDDVRRRCTQAGFDEFATKPLDLETIARRLDEVRRRRGNAGSSRHLDTRAFRLVGQGRPDGERQAAVDYLRILDREVAQIESHLGRGDSASLARSAHRLKAHAGLVHAVELREAAARLEQAAHRGDPGELDALGSEVAQLADTVSDQLKVPPESVAAG